METATPNTTVTIPYHGAIVPYYPANSTETTSAPFGVRIGKAFGMAFAALLIGGVIAAIGKGIGWNWLFWTGIGIGVLVFCVGMWQVFTLRLGKCPYCHQEIGRTSDITLASGDDNSQVECHICTNWLISHKGQIRAYTREDIKDTTEFKCKVMDQSTWPNECLACGAPPTRYVELKNTNLNAGMLLVGRISVSWGSLRNAPYCDQHMDIVKLKVEGKENMFLKFDDFDTMKRYQHVNYHKFMTGQHL